MDGPEHYEKAEELVDLANRRRLPGRVRRQLCAQAQVHATLALVAISAESNDPDGLNVPDWSRVIR